MGKLNVGLLWHSARSGNLGVGALTIGNLAIVRGVARDLGLEPRFVIIGMKERGPVYLDDPSIEIFDVDVAGMLRPDGLWSLYGRQDCILDIGGGDSFTDIYSDKRFVFLWITKALALARRVPLVLCPQTIGPFTRTPHKQLAARQVERSALVIARDKLSFEAARKLAPKANLHLSVDVAFALPFENRSAERGAGGKLRVGVNVSGLMFNQAEAGADRFGLGFDYARLTRNLLTALAARPDVETHLVTHVVSPWDEQEDDGRVADRLAKEYGCVRAPDFAGPSQAKSYISGLDFLVAGRMHACIAAFSSGVPVVPVAYSRKFSGLFGSLGYDWMIPMQGMDADAAVAYALDGLERRGELASDIATGMAMVEGLLDVYRGELRKLFTKIASR